MAKIKTKELLLLRLTNRKGIWIANCSIYLLIALLAIAFLLSRNSLYDNFQRFDDPYSATRAVIVDDYGTDISPSGDLHITSIIRESLELDERVDFSTIENQKPVQHQSYVRHIDSLRAEDLLDGTVASNPDEIVISNVSGEIIGQKISFSFDDFQKTFKVVGVAKSRFDYAFLNADAYRDAVRFSALKTLRLEIGNNFFATGNFKFLLGTEFAVNQDFGAKVYGTSDLSLIEEKIAASSDFKLFGTNNLLLDRGKPKVINNSSDGEGSRIYLNPSQFALIPAITERTTIFGRSLNDTQDIYRNLKKDYSVTYRYAYRSEDRTVALSSEILFVLTSLVISGVFSLLAILSYSNRDEECFLGQIEIPKRNITLSAILLKSSSAFIMFLLANATLLTMRYGFYRVGRFFYFLAPEFIIVNVFLLLAFAVDLAASIYLRGKNYDQN